MQKITAQHSMGVKWCLSTADASALSLGLAKGLLAAPMQSQLDIAPLRRRTLQVQATGMWPARNAKKRNLGAASPSRAPVYTKCASILLLAISFHFRSSVLLLYRSHGPTIKWSPGAYAVSSLSRSLVRVLLDGERAGVAAD